MARRVIFSDIHFGDPACSLQVRAVRDGLRSYLRRLGRVDELILAGDTLDTNVSTFTDAMFGRKDPATGRHQWGLKDWLRHIFRNERFAAKRVVFIPGNHDYAVWDHLCTYRHYLTQVKAGRKPDPNTVPKREGTFSDTYLSGLLPAGFGGTLQVRFPDHSFAVAGRNVLVTHGHYLDAKQTMGKNIRRMLESKAYRDDHERGRRRFFQYSAAYQASAHAVSYTRWMRVGVDEIHKFFGDLTDLVTGGIRGQAIRKGQLQAVEEYLKYYRQAQPQVFIFGHTHEAGHCKTSDFGRKPSKRLMRPVVDVWNIGSFVANGRSDVGSFIVVDDKPMQGEAIQLIRLDPKGRPMAG